MGSTMRTDLRRAHVLARIAGAWDKRPDLTLTALLTRAIRARPSKGPPPVLEDVHDMDLVAAVEEYADRTEEPTRP